ncbi:ATP-dependent DNA helicase sgs1 [Tulasnella sp. 408]|nr:ATP-dependent DNA helicase sgs1 [Tulasnella sp. 408]
MIEKGELAGSRLPPAEIQRLRDDVTRVVQYCQNITDCRRTLVLRYFGEQFDPNQCNARCNNCINNKDAVTEDTTEAAVDVLRLVQSLTSRDRITQLQAIDVFGGSKKKDYREKGFTEHALAGKWASMGRDQIERLFDHLLQEGALAQGIHHNKAGWHQTYLQASLICCILRDAKQLISSLLQLGPEADDFLHRGRRLTMLVQKKRNSSSSKTTQKRVVRKAVVSTTRTSVLQERSVVMEEIEEDEDDDYHPSTEDPIDEDFPPTRISRARIRPGRDNDADIGDLPSSSDEVGSMSIDPVTRCYCALKAVRTRIATEGSVSSVEAILSDETLQLIAAIQPRDVPSFKRALHEIFGDSGVAEAKWEQYGKRFLAAITDQLLGSRVHSTQRRSANENALRSPPPTPARPKSGGAAIGKPRNSFDSGKLRAAYAYQATASSTSSSVSTSSRTSMKVKGQFRPANAGGSTRPAGKSTGWIKPMPTARR